MSSRQFTPGVAGGRFFGYYCTMTCILGIETSCDETSAAVVKDGRLLSNITRTQLFHSKYGGVVPELASRAHQRLIIPIVSEALSVSGLRKEDLTGIAAVHGPGLIGSILVGLSFGKAMAMGLGIPFIGVNHMEAHILSNLIEPDRPVFPFVNLTVSGGHTQLVLVKSPLEYRQLGETRDDAAGEAFDKVAKMLGIGYPGGPLIDALARDGDPAAIDFPRPFLEENSMDFSFSGLKTSVLYYLKKNGIAAGSLLGRRKLLADICASFQAAVIDVLIHKVLLAAARFGTSDLALAGGVAANSELRRRLEAETKRRGLRLFIPKMEYCTDNGAMVAMAGYIRASEGRFSSVELPAIPNLALGEQEPVNLR